jgi:hypothetical protein
VLPELGFLLVGQFGQGARPIAGIDNVTSRDAA